MALYTDKEKAVNAIKNNATTLLDALSTQTTFKTVAVACEEKGIITEALRKALLDNTNSMSLPDRALEFIDEVKNTVKFQPLYLGDFLHILTVKGGVPGAETAKLIEYSCKLLS
jgi:hypothetical protein